jgi:hypothetical protein
MKLASAIAQNSEIGRLDLNCYQRIMKAVGGALLDAGGIQVLRQQSAFIASVAGRAYLDGIVRDVHAVRGYMTRWRWQLVNERAEEASAKDPDLSSC